jgi:hypothetical protein
LQSATQLSCGADGSGAYVPLQLQLLGCGRAASTADGSVSRCHSGAGSKLDVKCNTGIQELRIQTTNWLSDNELTAVAAALPDLRRPDLVAIERSQNGLYDSTGAGMAAFSACQRLRDMVLPCSIDLDAQRLLAQLARLTSLTSIYFSLGNRMDDDSAVMKLQAALQAEPRMGAICKWS